MTEPISNSKVLVTGGLGFVGAALVARALASANTVVVVDDCSLGQPANLMYPGDVELINANICDVEAVTSAVRRVAPDVVVHLAAVHFIPACESNPTLALGSNVGGTDAVIRAAVAANVSGIVFASTAAVYQPSTVPHQEDDAIGPQDIYGHTKSWGEQLFALHGRTIHHGGIGIARLFNVVGPGETNRHLIPEILQQANEKPTRLSLGDLSTRRDYIHVDDAADGLLRMGTLASAGERHTVNLGTGTASSGIDVIAALSGLLDVQLDVVRDESRIRSSDRPVLCCDPSHASEILSWQPQHDLVSSLASALARPTAPSYGAGDAPAR